jgi:DNA uptake protein ComE-like DNA-binding protein
MKRLLGGTLASLVAFALLACAGDAETGADASAAGDTSAASAGPTAGPPAATPTAAEGELIDPESATQQELTTIQGIDAATADAIIAARPIEDMREVDVILARSMDETQRDAVYGRLWKPIDLNNASDEEILLIPGIGDRMLHEFKEYRPYSQIEQFRREMGKYVDDEEVARMERYVEVR